MSRLLTTGILQQARNFANEPEVDTYISALTTPLSSAQIGRLNTFVKALKTGLSINALSDAFDVMYILAGETAESSLRNLVKNAHYAEAVNSPTFTDYEGFNSNGTSSYIKTNWNGRTSGHAVAYQLNSASFGLLYKNVINNTSLRINGCFSTIPDGEAFNRIQLAIDGNYTYCGLNSNFYGLADSNRFSPKYRIVTRINDSQINLYINKDKSTSNVSSSKIPNQELLVLALKSPVDIRNYDTSTIGFAFIGKGFSEIEVGIIIDAIEAYMDANGKGVIS